MFQFGITQECEHLIVFKHIYFVLYTLRLDSLVNVEPVWIEPFLFLTLKETFNNQFVTVPHLRRLNIILSVLGKFLLNISISLN